MSSIEDQSIVSSPHVFQSVPVMMRLLCPQLCHLVQQRHRLGRARDPRRRARQSSFEIVRSDRQELVADVERFVALDVAKVSLAGEHTPRLVADVNKDVVATVESAEREAYRSV